MKRYYIEIDGRRVSDYTIKYKAMAAMKEYENATLVTEDVEREEELENQEFVHNPYTFEKDGANIVGTYQTGFMDGAKWADENPSDELIEFIAKSVDQYVLIQRYGDLNDSDDDLLTFPEYIRKKLKEKKND